MEKYGPGSTISFRLPNDTPDHVYHYLNERKKQLGRKFSSEITPLFIQSISEKALQGDQPDSIEIKLPKGLSNEQKNWLTHPNTQALIGQLLYQIINQPTKPLTMNLPIMDIKSGDDSPSFKTNQTITNFAKKTFLNFDDDDE